MNNNTYATPELYHLVIPMAGLGIWERNLTTNTIYCNSIVDQIFEVDSGYVLDPASPLLFYKNPSIVVSLTASVVQTEYPGQAELELITAQGNLKWVRIRINTRLDHNNERSIFGTLEDISADVNLRRLIQEREQQFTNAFENAPIGMAMVSLTGSWLKVNKSLGLLLGLEQSNLNAQSLREITNPEDQSSDLGLMQDLLGGKIDQYSIEKRYFHKAGHTIWALLSVSLVRDHENAPLYFISHIKDITEIKHCSEIIKAQNAQLLNFAHIVSHNLRSHAGNIRMLSEMAAKEEEDLDKTILLSMLTESADNLLETLSQLNEVIKIKDAGLRDAREIYLKEEIQRVIKILATSIMKEKNININIDVPKNLTVTSSPSYLESIFINLLSNSILYRHPDRPAHINISAYPQAGNVIIKFSDNGLGIDMDLHRHKLFGMYKTFHENKEARGLGLFLIKNKIEAMGGTISAESVANTGTTMIIKLRTQQL